MSAVQEIEKAIKSLSGRERKKLVQDLPSILPELDGDTAWEEIYSTMGNRSKWRKFVEKAKGDIAAGKTMPFPAFSNS